MLGNLIARRASSCPAAIWTAEPRPSRPRERSRIAKVPQIALVTVTMMGALVPGAVDAAQREERTIWQGVFTSPQAGRGQALYVAHCSSCHHEDLSGQRGRLRGNRFWEDWKEDVLKNLFTRMKVTMPFDNPSSLRDAEYLDILTFILRENGLPAGDTELEVDGLERIRIQEKGGAGPVPNFSLVVVVGCLIQGSDGAWMLTRATEPLRTSDPTFARQAESKGLDPHAAGPNVFRLLDLYPSPDAHKGQKLAIKGLLIRAANDDRLNVTSIQSLALNCER